MAIENLNKKSLVLYLDEGSDLNGDPIIKRFSYGNIKEESTPDALSQAASALAALYQGSVHVVNTIDTNILM